jgi:hypothetical protein
MDYNSTIRRMKKFLPSVKVLRHQFESKNVLIQSEVKSKHGNKNAAKQNEAAAAAAVKDPSASVRKWKSTSNFHQQDSASSTEAERSRSSSLGSLDEITSTTSSASSSGQGSSGSSTSGHHSSATLPENVTNKKDHSASVISLIQPIICIDSDDKEKDYDMYRPRHSTAQWNPVSFGVHFLLKILKFSTILNFMKFYFRHLCWTICTKSKSRNRMKRAQRINRAHRLSKELWINCHQDAVKQHSGTLGNVDSFKPRMVTFTVIKYVLKNKKRFYIFYILTFFSFWMRTEQSIRKAQYCFPTGWRPS